MLKSHLKKNLHSIKTPVFLGVFGLLCILLFLSVILAVGFGSVDISSDHILSIVLYRLFHIGSIDHLPKSLVDIVYNIRLPRIILALMVGIGLSISGVIMQAIVKNSLADPYILGVSSGASLGATLSIMLGIGSALGPNYVGWSACIVAFLSSLLVMSIANLRGRANPMKLIMSGVAVSSMFSAFSSFIIYTSSNREGMKSVGFWLMGGLSGAKWENMLTISFLVLIALFFFISQYRTLNLMLLGDEVSITLGKDLHLYRQIYLLVVSVIIGFVVYNAGIIGFIGLIIPHISRLFFGTDHKKIIPVSAVLGGIILIWSDVLARSLIAGNEIPVGIIISLVGAPAFVYLLISREYGFGGGR